MTRPGMEPRSPGSLANANNDDNKDNDNYDDNLPTSGLFCLVKIKEKKNKNNKKYLDLAKKLKKL